MRTLWRPSGEVSAYLCTMRVESDAKQRVHRLHPCLQAFKKRHSHACEDKIAKVVGKTNVTSRRAARPPTPASLVEPRHRPLATGQERNNYFTSACLDPHCHPLTLYLGYRKTDSIQYYSPTSKLCDLTFPHVHANISSRLGSPVLRSTCRHKSKPCRFS